jgi:hypothetical protein
MRVGDNLTVYGTLKDHTAQEALAFWPATPVRVVRWGIICGVDLTGTGGTASLYHDPYEVDGTPNQDTTAGTTTLTGAACQIGVLQYVEPTTEVVCKPGDKLSVVITGAFDAGDYYAFIQYQALNWDETGVNATFDDTTPTFGKLVDVST